VGIDYGLLLGMKSVWALARCEKLRMYIKEWWGRRYPGRMHRR
jgi:hypothetical protein